MQGVVLVASMAATRTEMGSLSSLMQALMVCRTSWLMMPKLPMAFRADRTWKEQKNTLVPTRETDGPSENLRGVHRSGTCCRAVCPTWWTAAGSRCWICTVRVLRAQAVSHTGDTQQSHGPLGDGIDQSLFIQN